MRSLKIIFTPLERKPRPKDCVKDILRGWCLKPYTSFLTGFTVLVLVICFSINNLHAEEPRVTGSASVGVFNRFIFRGYELSSDSIVIQPALNISYRGFAAGFWGNIDSDEHATQSFVPDREGRKSFNETDLTLSYTYAIGKLSLTGGYIYYGTLWNKVC